MKEFISRLKKIDKTKKLVILFITVSFVFIFGITSYNALTGRFENNKTATTVEVEKKSKSEKELVEKNTDEEVEEDNKEEKSNQDENKNDESKKNTNSEKDNESSSKNNKKSTTSTKQENNTSSTKINDKNSNSSNNNSSNNNSSNDKNNNVSNSNQTTQPSQPIKETISVHVQVIGIGNTMMSGTLTVEKGANAYSVLKELASINGKTVSGSTTYVTGIGGLNEKAHGPASGWMYKVNGYVPPKPAIAYTLNNGDNVVWYYVNYE